MYEQYSRAHTQLEKSAISLEEGLTQRPAFWYASLTVKNQEFVGR